jgi:hypothetical protein
VTLVACAVVVMYSALSRFFRCEKKSARRFLRYNSTYFIDRYLVDLRGRESSNWAGVRALGVVVCILATTRKHPFVEAPVNRSALVLSKITSRHHSERRYVISPKKLAELLIHRAANRHRIRHEPFGRTAPASPEREPGQRYHPT